MCKGLWVWFLGFALVGCSKAVGTFDGSSNEKVQSPGPSGGPSNVWVKELGGDPLPGDLGVEHSFPTLGWVFARENYVNHGATTVKIWTSVTGSTLTLETGISSTMSAAAVQSANQWISSTPLSIAVTATRDDDEIKRLSDSVLGSSVDLQPGEQVTLSWRMGPQAGLSLVELHQGSVSYPSSCLAMEQSFSVTGSEIVGTYSRESFTGEDASHADEVLYSEQNAPGQVSGQTPSGPVNRLFGGVLVDYENANPLDYYVAPSCDTI